MAAEVTQTVKALAPAWEKLSLKRGISLAALTRRAEDAVVVRDVLLSAGANPGDTAAGLTNFLRRIRSFLKRDGAWLTPENTEITDFLVSAGAVAIDGSSVTVLLPRALPDAAAFAAFEAETARLRDVRSTERAARRATLQAKNRLVNAVKPAAVDSALDARAMAEALHEAQEAAERGEVPVGAVVVYEGSIIARAGNRVKELKDPTAHAEILAIKKACAWTGNERLTGAVLYVTLEPCPMCAAAAALARVARIVWGADDMKCGALKSTVNVIEACRMNHRPTCTCGVEKDAAVKLLQDFFAGRRKEKAR